MPSVKTPNTRPEQDEAYNPSDLHERERFSPQSATDRELKNIGDNYDQTADSSQEDANIAKAKSQEQNGGTRTIPYSGGGGKKRKFDFKAFMKKAGPTGLILGGILGGGGIFMFLGSGGMLLVQLKEIYSDHFNDRLAALDARVTKIVETDLKDATTGICTSKLTIRCKMNTMSTKRFNSKIKPELEKRGYTVDSQRTINPLRTRITQITAPDGTVITAQNYKRMFQRNTNFRSAMLHSLYNPKFASTADRIATKVNGKLGISKRKNLDADSSRRTIGEAGDNRSVQDKLKEDLAKNAGGEGLAEAEAGVERRVSECSGGDGCVDGQRTEYVDSQTGDTISQSDYESRIGQVDQFSEEVSARKALTETGEAVTKATIKGALTSTAFGLGAVDTGCTGYQLIRTVSFAAKYLGALQLARYAFTFMNTADAIKAGDASPEEVEALGNVLTSTNDIGQSATDSYGYKYVAYGDTAGMPRPEDVEGTHDSQGQANISEEEQEKVLLHDETLKYVNGQIVSEGLLGTLTDLAGASVDEMDDVCEFVKSGWGQTILIGTAVVGAVVGFFTGGATIGWGVAAQIAASVAIGVAIAILTPKLVDMAAGTMIDGSENGNQAGNAITSGMGMYNAQLAQGAGVPALTPEDAVAYKNLTQETIARNAEVERLEAHPLDATNPHTFMGTVASKITPFFAGVSNIGSFFASAGKFITNTFARIIPSAGAQDATAEYAICQDIDYKEMGIAVDPFCNARYGMKAETLDIDPNVPINYMLDNNYVDEETGEPTDSGNDYGKYIEDCMERSVSIGGYTEDNSDKGEKCIQGRHSGDEEYKYNMFRLYYIDQTIIQTMDEGYDNERVSNEEVNGPVTAPVTSGTVTAGYGLRTPPPGSSSQPTWTPWLNINSLFPDVVAIMEGEVIAIEGSAKIVVIRHNDGLVSRYSYMKNIAVEVGDTVTSGQKIGEIGCTGRQANCNAYLAFAIWVDGVTNATNYSQYPRAPQGAGEATGRAINPANFLTDNGVTGYQNERNDQ